MSWRQRLRRLWHALQFARTSTEPRTEPTSQPIETTPAPTFEERLHELSMSWDSWWAGYVSEPNPLYGKLSSVDLDSLKARQPDRVAGILRRAEAIMEHRFCLLGSDEFRPIDPGRPAKLRKDGTEYHPILWRFDPVSDQTFPAGFAHTEWSFDRAPTGADIKLPWELGRGQHWLTLTQAYELSGQHEFAREVLDQWLDFGEAHPTDGRVGEGIQWVCTMDVAIRAANAALALNAVRDADWSEEEVTSLWPRAIGQLFRHAYFIRNNLEDHYEVTSNHFLSNVVGLQFVAEIFSGIPEGNDWSQFARRRIAAEIPIQVLPDGADFESSVPYHRLVTELFLASGCLARRTETPYPEEYDRVVERMVTFLGAVERPDGVMPQSGDADDGRFHIFTDYGAGQPERCTHLFAPAGHYFGRADWITRGGPLGDWERAGWGFSSSNPAGQIEDNLPPAYQHFPDSGLAVHRDGGDYVLISNGRVGTEGFGNHKHNDLLGFELHFGGQPFLIDPGTGAYTGAPDLRNQLRSVTSHNTLQIDDHEPNEYKPEWLFRMFETSHAQHLHYEGAAAETVYVGRHGGFARFAPGAWVERGLCFRPKEGVLYISDQAYGQGSGRVRWHFHLAPGVEPAVEGNTIVLSAGSKKTWLTFPAGLEVELGTGTYSQSYGVGTPCRTIDLREESNVSFEARQSWFFAIGTESWYRTKRSDSAEQTREQNRLEQTVRTASESVELPPVPTATPF